jgi:hypothetical protein
MNLRIAGFWRGAGARISGPFNGECPERSRTDWAHDSVWPAKRLKRHAAQSHGRPDIRIARKS